MDRREIGRSPVGDCLDTHMGAADDLGLMARLQRRSVQLRALADASLLITSQRDLDEVAQTITEAARSIIGAHQAVTSLTHADHSQAIHATSLSEKYAAWREFAAPPDGSGIYRLVCAHSRVMRLTQAELEAHPAWRGFGAHAASHPPMRGWLAAPLHGRDGSVIGLIQLSDRYRGDFTEEDEAILVQLAQLASIAITNLRLYEQLEDAHRRKDEFLAMLGHELRNPAAAITQALALLRTGDGPRRERALGTLERQAGQLGRLLDDLLEVGRISIGKIELRRSFLDLRKVVESAAETMAPAAASRQLSLACELGAAPAWVDGDETRLEQVLSNLLHNAVRYTDAGGRVLVRLQREAREVEVRVTDDGRGIDPAVLPRIFDLFVQEQRPLARTEGGLGIGLTLVHKLVELHGGTVRARSAGIGKGSEFVVRLPLVEAPQAQVDGNGEAGDGAQRALQVLVVDDNVDIAATLGDLLELSGHRVELASDGPAALAAAIRMRPDVVLLDIGLPGMDGLEVARRLRREESLRGTMLVALSGYGQETDVERSLEAGFDCHLVKPVRMSQLEAVLASRAQRA